MLDASERSCRQGAIEFVPLDAAKEGDFALDFLPRRGFTFPTYLGKKQVPWKRKRRFIFCGSTQTPLNGFIGLDLENYVRLVPESKRELFEMNYSQLEGLESELGSYAPSPSTSPLPLSSNSYEKGQIHACHHQTHLKVAYWFAQFNSMLSTTRHYIYQ